MKHALVRALVMHYLDHFGYRGPRVRIYTTATRALKELERKRDRAPADERSTRKDFGWCYRYPRSTVIYVNVRKHDSLGELLDTCAHEALHATGKDSHPPDFDAEVAEGVLA